MKIYDCFTFNDENDLLEIRINCLKDIVDFFVIVECKYTHQGNIKGKKIDSRILDKFKHRIKYFYIDKKIDSNNSWEIEAWQRNQLSMGLNSCQPDDIIIVSDLDEIPNLDNFSFDNIGKKVFAFDQALLMYKLNLVRNRRWIGSKICKFLVLKSPQWLRQLKVHKRYSFLRLDKFFSKTYYHKFEIIKNGGWHFGWLRSSSEIIEKVQSYAHTEHNIPRFKDKNYIDSCIKNNINFLNGFEKMKKLDDENLPKYIKENLEKYKKWMI